MKLIKPNYLIMNQESGMSGLLKHIELCGRTAYKSEDQITEESAPKFVDMLIKRGHGAVLEHGTVYLKMNVYHREAYFKYCHNDYSVANSIGEAEATLNPNKMFTKPNLTWQGFVTTNYRVLIENGWLDDLQYQCEPTEYHEKRLSVKFICDRGVSHEFVRHRVFSFVQESTRYCNYSKDKFGTECTFIIPSWLDLEELIEEFGDLEKLGYHKDIDKFQSSEWSDAANFLQSIAWSEVNYLTLLTNGWTPQQARSVLPNSLKTELIMTGTVTQWQGFFKLRCAPDAHPQARELAIPLQEEFKKLGYV